MTINQFTKVIEFQTKTIWVYPNFLIRNNTDEVFDVKKLSLY